MASTGPSTSSTTSATPERTLGQLVADATHDVQSLVRDEVALAKAELSVTAKRAGAGAGMFAGAAFVGLLALIFLFHTLVAVLDIWLPEWAGYAITTGLLLLVAAVLGLLGKRQIDRMQPKPEKTIDNAQRTIAAIKHTD